MRGSTLLYKACETGDEDMVDKLIAKDVKDVNKGRISSASFRIFVMRIPPIPEIVSTHFAL